MGVNTGISNNTMAVSVDMVQAEILVSWFNPMFPVGMLPVEISDGSLNLSC